MKKSTHLAGLATLLKIFWWVWQKNCESMENLAVDNI
jgi:hypothetical protein